MSSYSQQSKENGPFPNGIPPQMSPYSLQNQQQSTQNAGMNKFFPPTSQYLPPPQQYQPIVNATKNNILPPVPLGALQQQSQLPQLQAAQMQHLQQNNLLLTNGDNSTHSSRTASPALNSSINQSINSAHLPPGRSPVSSAMNQTRMAQAPPTNTNLNRNNFVGSTQNVSNLSGSMQNLSVGQLNGPIQPPLNQAAKQPIGNYQINGPNLNYNQNQYTSQNSAMGIMPPPPTSSQQNMFPARVATGSLYNNSVPTSNTSGGQIPPVSNNQQPVNVNNPLLKIDQTQNSSLLVQNTNQYMLNNNNPPPPPSLQPQQSNFGISCNPATRRSSYGLI